MGVFVEAKQFPLKPVEAQIALDGIRWGKFYATGKDICEIADGVVNKFLEFFPEAGSWDITMTFL